MRNEIHVEIEIFYIKNEKNKTKPKHYRSCLRTTLIIFFDPFQMLTTVYIDVYIFCTISWFFTIQMYTFVIMIIWFFVQMVLISLKLKMLWIMLNHAREQVEIIKAKQRQTEY